MSEPVIPDKMPAVDPVTRALNFVSVSSLAKFNDEVAADGEPVEHGGCNKRWWFKYVEHLPEPQTVAQEDGTKLHAQVEHYEKTGENVLGAMGKAGQHLLPAPGADLLIEWGLNDKPKPKSPDGKKEKPWFPPEESLLRADGVPVIGFIDTINPRGTYVSPEGLLLQDPPGTIEVVDNKTSSNLKYAKKSDELIQTTQMAGYAEFLTTKYLGLKNARVSHVVFQKKKFEALKSTALIPVEVVKQKWEERGHQVARRMREVALLREEAKVPGNPNSCRAYNKLCAFSARCSTYMSQTPISRLKLSLKPQQKESNVMSTLLERVRGITGAPSNGATSNGAPAPAAPAAPAAAAPPAPAAQTFPGFMLKELMKAGAITQGQPFTLPSGSVGMFLNAAAEGDVTIYNFLPVQGGAPIKLKSTDFVTPTTITQPAPTAPPIQATPAPQQPPVVNNTPWITQAPTPPATRIPIIDLTQQQAVAAQAEPVAATETPAAPTGEAPKRTRGPNKAKAAPAATEATFFSLYVNAIPNGPFQSLDGYVKTLTDALCAQLKVEDIRAVDNDSPLAFGKWKGILSALAKAEPPPFGVWVALHGGEVTDVVVEALAGLCGPGALVRGVR